jgi:chemotaxis protein CheX
VSIADVPADAHAIETSLRSRVLTPFIAGVEVAFREVARTEVVEHAAYERNLRGIVGDWGVYIELKSTTEGVLALGYEQATALTLARRMLAETAVVPDESLVRDCAGELANVVAGQAKAFLAETPDRFTFSPPKFAPPGVHIAPPEMQKCLVVIFDTDAGNIALQLFLRS